MHSNNIIAGDFVCAGSEYGEVVSVDRASGSVFIKRTAPRLIDGKQVSEIVGLASDQVETVIDRDTVNDMIDAVFGETAERIGKALAPYGFATPPADEFDPLWDALRKLVMTQIRRGLADA